MPAGDVPDRGSEDGDHQAARERRRQKRRLIGRAGGGHERAGADEDQRERAHELGHATAEDVAAHCSRTLRLGSDADDVLDRLLLVAGCVRIV